MNKMKHLPNGNWTDGNTKFIATGIPESKSFHGWDILWNTKKDLTFQYAATGFTSLEDAQKELDEMMTSWNKGLK